MKPTAQQLQDARRQIEDCVNGNATDCILNVLSDDAIIGLAEDFNAGDMQDGDEPRDEVS